MTNTNTDSDPDFCFPSSSSSLHQFPFHHLKMRKKRTKMIKIESCSNLVTTNATSSSKIVSKPKKPDPSAPKITRPCSECGKKFWSWKALFGHMRCHPERQWRGINPPPNCRRPLQIQEKGEDQAVVMMTSDDHEVAACLLLLANSDHHHNISSETECEFHVQNDMMNCRFECSSCKKVFGSHQALGGHRASHKNVKCCFAITRTSDDCDIIGEGSSGINANCDVKENVEDNKMVMVLGHKCSICLRVFSSGQALGGHKRCHWEKGEEASSSMNHQLGLNGVVFAAKENCGLDLNMPAPVEDECLTLDLRLGL